MTLPRSSRTVDHAPAKLRISAWEALVWAYANENVRAVGGYLTIANDFSHRRWPDASRIDYDDIHQATVRGYLQAHADAVAIDAFVSRETKGNAAHYLAIVKAAEARMPVPARLDLPERRCVPVLVQRRGVMVPKMLYPPKGRKEPIACYVDIVGIPPDEIDRLQRAQAHLQAIFLALLGVMEARLELSRWIIVGTGLTSGGESLTQASMSCALRPEA